MSKSSRTSTIQDERNRNRDGNDGDTSGSEHYQSQSDGRKCPERTDRKGTILEAFVKLCHDNGITTKSVNLSLFIKRTKKIGRHELLHMR